MYRGVPSTVPVRVIVDRAGEGTLPVAEELALRQRRGERPAVDRDEGPAATRRGVEGARQDLLAGAALPADHHRDPRRRHRRDPLEVGGEGGEQRRRPGHRLVGAGQVRADPARRAHGEEGLPDLQEVALVERRAVHARAVQQRAVLRAGVVELPAARAPHEPSVDGGHPRIVHPEDAAVAPGLERQPFPAADLHLGDAREGQPRRRRLRIVGAEREEEVQRLGLGALPLVHDRRKRPRPHATVLAQPRPGVEPRGAPAMWRARAACARSSRPRAQPAQRRLAPVDLRGEHVQPRAPATPPATGGRWA
jgi:hypothetical protein